MHDGVHFLRGQINVRLTVVWDQEAVAITVALQLALDLAEQRATRATCVQGWGACVLKIFDDRILVFPEMPST